MDTHLQSIALLLGITEPVNGTWIEAIARHEINITTFNLVDVEALFTALLADPFVVADWKGSFFTSFTDPVGSGFKGVYESDGDFETELSYRNYNGIIDGEFGPYKETIFLSALFRPTDGTLLGSMEQSYNLKIGTFDNVEITYKYEENLAATGANPKYVHDFRITIDSTQVLGYVVIYADDTDFNNFIITSAGA